MGFKIKEHRQKIGMSQEELAEKSGVSRAIISGLESGRVTVTSTKTIEKIAKALDKEVSDIFYSASA